MTERQTGSGAASAIRARLPKGLLWPATFLIALGTAMSLHRDAVDTKLEWLFWLTVSALGLLYVIVGLIYLTRFLRSSWRRWTEFAEKARGYDGVSAAMARWEGAAGAATARAEDAEQRLKTWHRDTLVEGRRRLLAELEASSTRSTFGDIEVAVVDDVLVVGARWARQSPKTDTRYLMRSGTLRETKAVLEVVEIRQDRTVVFRVAAIASAEYRSSLVSRAQAAGSALANVEIVPRDKNFEEEPVWPEN